MASRNALEKGESESTGNNSPKKPTGLRSITTSIVKLFSTKKSGLQESIEEILEGEGHQAETPLDAGEKAILKNVLEFKELHVEDIMIPRADIFAIPEDIQFPDLQVRLLDKTYTRIPVYKNNLDEIQGFIHIKDIARTFFNNKNFEIADVLRKCMFVPPSMKISNLLIRMQQTRVHIAIVIDEYGGTEGIVTLEDIVEEIVGNIEDEHDEDESLSGLKKISDDIYEVSSRILIEEFYGRTGIDISIQDAENQFNTVGGLVTYLLGRIPVKGEIITFNEKVELEVTEADARSVKRLVIKKKG